MAKGKASLSVEGRGAESQAGYCPDGSCLPPTPLAYLQTVQGHYPRYHPSQACRRRVEPSQQHSDSYDCYCKPKTRIEKSPGGEDLQGHPDPLGYSPHRYGRQSSNVPAPGR